MKRALVLAYYFPPLGLSGVQRVAKFVKYLPEFGFEPIVVTAAPKKYFAFDSTMLDELRHVEIWRTASRDPTRLVSVGGSTMPPEAIRKTASKVSQWLFIPDNKKGWGKPAFEKSVELHRANPFDCIFSSAPPYTSHIVAARISKQLDLPLLLDYRDDWVNNPRHTYITPFHKRAHQRLQAEVNAQASAITTINPYISASLAGDSQAVAEKVSVVPQGFDPADFSNTKHDRNPKCVFTFSGVFYGAQQPDSFLKAVRLLRRRNPQLAARAEFRFIGLMPSNFAKRTRDLKDLVRVTGYINHRSACDELLNADVLWFIIGRQRRGEMISTGKLYEYMGARKRILALVPSGAAADELKHYGEATIVDPDDVESIAEAIGSQIELWAAGVEPTINNAFVDSFNRRELAGVLASKLEAICEVGS